MVPFVRSRYLLFTASIAALLVVGFSTPTLADDPASHDLQAIVNAGHLRVAITQFDLPSFHSKGTDGKVGGPEADLAKQIARALNVQVDFVDTATSFDAVVGAVADGRADIGISKLSKTYYRLKAVRFSDPYISLRHSLLYNRAILAENAQGGAPVDALRRFSGRIGVIRGSAYVDFANRNFPTARVVELDDWSEVVSALKENRIDAVYRDEFEIRHLSRKDPTLNVRFGIAIIADQFAHLSIAICSNCSRLQEFVNFYLSETRGAFSLKSLLNNSD